jgi:hypothetical protein
MTAPPAVSPPAVSLAAEARRRKERRRRIGAIVAVVVMVVILVGVSIGAIGFNNSWWTQANPVASNDQKAPDGSSAFSQAGIDYFTRTGVVKVSMGADRPTSRQLGLSSSGTKHIDFLVPLTVRASAGSPLTFSLVDSLDVISSGGRLSAIEITPNDAYEQLIGDVHALAPQVGWSDSALAAFDAQLTSSRQASGGDSFTATVGPAASTGMRVSATLSGDSNSAPKLVIHVGAASR